MDEPFDLPPDVLRRVPLFAEISKVLSWTGGPVNWDLARQIAVTMAASEGTPAPVTEAQHEEAATYVRTAELWLTESAAIPTPSHVMRARAATPVDWAEHATKAFAELIDPVAAKVAKVMSEQTPDAQPEAGMLAQALGQLAPMFMGIQAGTMIGTLAREVTGSHETGLPTGDDELILVLSQIDEFARSYGLDERATRQWVAARAAAHRLVFEAFPDVRTQFFARYHNYVASLDVDLAQGIQRLGELDFTNPERLQEAIGDEGLFSHQQSPETAAAAARVGSFLAVVESYTSEAVAAVAERAGDTGRIAEAYARRALEGGAGRRMLTGFIGLDTPANQRDADSFVRTVREQAGWSALGRLWEDAELFPTDAELTDPGSWIARVR